MSDKNLTLEEIAQLFAEDDFPQSNDILNISKINESLDYLPKEKSNNSVESERSELSTFPTYFRKREDMLKAVAASDMNCFSVSLVKIIIDGVEERLYKVVKLPDCIEDIKLK